MVAVDLIDHGFWHKWYTTNLCIFTTRIPISIELQCMPMLKLDYITYSPFNLWLMMTTVKPTEPKYQWSYQPKMYQTGVTATKQWQLQIQIFGHRLHRPFLKACLPSSYLEVTSLRIPSFQEKPVFHQGSSKLSWNFCGKTININSQTKALFSKLSWNLHKQKKY